MRMGCRGALAAAAGTVVLASMTVAPASARSPQKTIEHLRHQRDTARRHAKTYHHQRDTARRHAKTYRRQRDTARRTVGRQDRKITGLQGQLKTTSGQLSTATGQVSTLSGQVTTLQRENAALREGLPNAISAVPIADFPRLVFAPARAAWPCDSFFSSGGYWSYSFDSPDPYC